MLTSVFYYNLYKPYILSNANTRDGDNYAPRRNRIADRRDAPTAAGPVFVLNKSLKNEMVSYARGVSYGVVGLRSATARTAQGMQDFNRTAHAEGWVSAQRTLADNLSAFADVYNRSSGFMQNQNHSAGLRDFSYEVADSITGNRERLALLGISLSETGYVAFDAGRLEALSFEEINTAVDENIDIFSGLHAFTQQLLSEPLVDHMRFAGLNYHYNYQRGIMESDGFMLLETGLLVDKTV